MTFPRIHLAIDNCFASKRWVSPADWMREISDLGVSCIEASADTELDPLYHGPDWLARWTGEVQDCAGRYRARVVNLYSGHGTYATLGLAHVNRQVRSRVLDEWIAPMINVASAVDAGLGFYAHAFPQSVLADPSRFRDELADLTLNLATVARMYAESHGQHEVGVEQMYSPHQVPWTAHQARELVAGVYGVNRDPFYITLDVGHQSAQRRFLRPDRAALEAAVETVSADGAVKIWIGPDNETNRVIEASALTGRARQKAISELEKRLEAFPYLYAEEADGDPYHWLRQLAGWSPIVHLQQTDGTRSAHLPFTEENNRVGIVDGGRVLRAIYDHYSDADDQPALPRRVEDIYLTIEIFSGTAETPTQIRANLKESVAYWRQFVPRDGLTIDKLVT